MKFLTCTNPHYLMVVLMIVHFLTLERQRKRKVALTRGHFDMHTGTCTRPPVFTYNVALTENENSRILPIFFLTQHGGPTNKIACNSWRSPLAMLLYVRPRPATWITCKCQTAHAQSAPPLFRRTRCRYTIALHCGRAAAVHGTSNCLLEHRNYKYTWLSVSLHGCFD